MSSLPYHIDQLEVPAQYYPPDSPPFVPPINIALELQPFFLQIAATVANEITNAVGQSPARMFFYNEVTRNQWNTPGYIEAVGLTADYLLLMLKENVVQDVASGIDRATSVVVRALACHRIYTFPNLKAYHTKKQLANAEKIVKQLAEIREAVAGMYAKMNPNFARTVDEFHATSSGFAPIVPQQSIPQPAMRPTPQYLHPNQVFGRPPYPPATPPPGHQLPPKQAPAFGYTHVKPHQQQQPTQPQFQQQPPFGYGPQQYQQPLPPQFQQQPPFGYGPQQYQQPLPPQFQQPVPPQFQQQPPFGYGPQPYQQPLPPQFQQPVPPQFQQQPPFGYGPQPYQQPLPPQFQQPVPPQFQQQPPFGYGPQPYQQPFGYGPSHVQQPFGYGPPQFQQPVENFWQPRNYAPQPFVASVAGSRHSVITPTQSGPFQTEPERPDPLQQGPFFVPGRSYSAPANPVAAPQVTPPPVSPVILDTALKWASSEEQPYLVLVNEDTHTDGLVCYNNQIYQQLTPKETVMNRDTHQIVVLGESHRKQPPVVDEEQSAFDAMFKLAEKEAGGQPPAMVAIRNDIESDPVQAFFLDRQLFLSEHELDLRATDKNCEALTTFVSLNTPVGDTKNMAKLMEMLSEATDFVQLQKRIVSFNQAASKSQMQANVLIEISKVLLAVDARLTQLVNDFLSKELSLTPGFKITSFTADVDSIEAYLRTNYGDRIADAFIAYQESALNAIFKNTLSNAVLIELLRQQTLLDEDELAAAVFLTERLTVTQLTALNSELNITLGEEPRIVDAVMHPWLYQVVHSVFSAKNHKNYETTKDLLITADRVTYTLHRGVLADDVYLISR